MSRNPLDLHPDLQPIYAEFKATADERGIDYILTCTYRSNADQDQLYAQGRTLPGLIVTRARGGQSAHNFTINGKPAAKAFDIVPSINGKPQWSTSCPSWQQLGQIAMDLGLDWYGAPDAPFKEFPHCQMKDFHA